MAVNFAKLPSAQAVRRQAAKPRQGDADVPAKHPDRRADRTVVNERFNMACEEFSCRTGQAPHAWEGGPAASSYRRSQVEVGTVARSLLVRTYPSFQPRP
jgi:hypothetical protein